MNAGMDNFNMLFLLIALVVISVESQDVDDWTVYLRYYDNCEDPDIREPWEDACIPTDSFGCIFNPARCVDGYGQWLDKSQKEVEYHCLFDLSCDAYEYNSKYQYGRKCSSYKAIGESTNFPPLCKGTAGYDSWSAWSTCRGRCGKGKRERTRTCSHGAINGGQACVGPSYLPEPCIPNGCPDIPLCKDEKTWCVKLTDEDGWYDKFCQGDGQQQACPKTCYKC